MCCLGALFSSPSRLIPSLVLLLVSERLWFSVAHPGMGHCWNKYTFLVPEGKNYPDQRFCVQLPEVPENAVSCWEKELSLL